MSEPLIVFLGPTGSGKTTQATRIAEHFGYGKITTGDLVRTRIANGDMTVEAIKEFNDGRLVYTDSVSELVNQELFHSTYQGLVLDGYPRTLSQYKNMSKLLPEIGRLLTAVVYTNIDKAAAMRRVLTRNRSDDSLSAFENRYNQFTTHTVPLLDKLGNAGNLIQVDGTGNIDRITAEIVVKLGQFSISD